MRYHDDLYWKHQLACDLPGITQGCLELDTWVREHCKDAPDPLDEKFHIHDVYNNYNVFAYPLPGFSELFYQLRESFAQISDASDTWIKAWVNVYNDSASHVWHQHKSHTWLDRDHEPVHASWHGIYCVRGDDTCTTYRSKQGVTVHIPWQDNQVAFIQNTPDWMHRSWPSKQEQPRITIAFNVMHRQDIDVFRYHDHWIPFT
jgi:hypothetical protein